MKQLLDELEKELNSMIEESDAGRQSEKLSGNIVKEEFWKGHRYAAACLAAWANNQRVDTAQCLWAPTQDGYWNTGCSRVFEFAYASWQANGFVHCPYCGRAIKELKESV